MKSAEGSTEDDRDMPHDPSEIKTVEICRKSFQAKNSFDFAFDRKC